MLGSFLGYHFVHEVVRDPRIRPMVDKLASSLAKAILTQNDRGGEKDRLETSATSNAQPGDTSFRGFRHRGAIGRFWQNTETGRERDGCSAAQLTIDPYVPIHQFHQTFGYGKPKARAAVFPGRRGIHLGELFKYVIDPVFWNTDPRIGYAETKFDRLGLF